MDNNLLCMDVINRVESNCLDICFPPPMYFSHHVATSLSIIMANNENKDWFYNNFIQATFYNDFANIGSGHLYGIYPAMETRLRHFAASQYLMETCINLNILNLMSDRLCENVKLFIDNGYYVSCVADVSRLKGTRYAQRDFFSHRIMIFGYDFKSHTLDILDFDHKQALNKIKVMMDDFLDAFYSERLCAQLNGHKNNTLVLYERKTRPFTADFGLVREALSDYLNSYNSSKRYSLILPCDECSSWGIATYAKMVEYLNSVPKKSEGIDIRMAHAFYEHKKIMYDRFEYFAARKIYSTENKIRKQLESNVRIAEIIRLLVIKYNQTKDVKIISTIINKLKDIEEAEKYLYKKLLES